MVKIDVNKVISRDESYYSFVLGVAKRAREITDEQLKKVKEVIDLEKNKSNVLDRTKQLPDELSVKPVRLAVEELKEGKCKLVIEDPVEVNKEYEEEKRHHDEERLRVREEQAQEQEEESAAREAERETEAAMDIPEADDETGGYDEDLDEEEDE